MSTLTSQSSTRANAALVLARHHSGKFGGDVRDHLARYLGFTGGDHILRDKRGRVWSVDLVTGSCVLNVGTMPEQWKHPPRLAS